MIHVSVEIFVVVKATIDDFIYTYLFIDAYLFLKLINACFDHLVYFYVT
jgi:hypothetical protein